MHHFIPRTISFATKCVMEKLVTYEEVTNHLDWRTTIGVELFYFLACIMLIQCQSIETIFEGESMVKY